MPVLVICKFEENLIRNEDIRRQHFLHYKSKAKVKCGDMVFTIIIIISQREVSVAMATTVWNLLQNQPFPHPTDDTHKIRSRLAN